MLDMQRDKDKSDRSPNEQDKSEDNGTTCRNNNREETQLNNHHPGSEGEVKTHMQQLTPITRHYEKC